MGREVNTFEKIFLADLLKGVDNVRDYIEDNFVNLIIHKSTCRQYVLNDPRWAYWFAMKIDMVPRSDTRIVCCRDPWWACKYALEVDRKFTEETWAAVKGTNREEIYRLTFRKYDLDLLEKVAK